MKGSLLGKILLQITIVLFFICTLSSCSDLLNNLENDKPEESVVPEVPVKQTLIYSYENIDDLYDLIWENGEEITIGNTTYKTIKGLHVEKIEITSYYRSSYGDTDTILRGFNDSLYYYCYGHNNPQSYYFKYKFTGSFFLVVSNTFSTKKFVYSAVLVNYADIDQSGTSVSIPIGQYKVDNIIERPDLYGRVTCPTCEVICTLE
ncbi:MAG: hypothetical protein IK024_10015 [Treponema sp.]|nr:hypothetical protein [Treponema sp.]